MSLESLPRPIHGGKTRVIVDDLVDRSGAILFSLFSEELQFNSLCYCYFNFNPYYYFFVLDPFIEVLFVFNFIYQFQFDIYYLFQVGSFFFSLALL
jgi:hypothetical protein